MNALAKLISLEARFTGFAKTVPGGDMPRLRRLWIASAGMGF